MSQQKRGQIFDQFNPWLFFPSPESAHGAADIAAISHPGFWPTHSSAATIFDFNSQANAYLRTSLFLIAATAFSSIPRQLTARSKNRRASSNPTGQVNSFCTYARTDPEIGRAHV